MIANAAAAADSGVPVEGPLGFFVGDIDVVASEACVSGNVMIDLVAAALSSETVFGVADPIAAATTTVDRGAVCRSADATGRRILRHERWLLLTVAAVAPPQCGHRALANKRCRCWRRQQRRLLLLEQAAPRRPCLFPLAAGNVARRSNA